MRSTGSPSRPASRGLGPTLLRCAAILLLASPASAETIVQGKAIDPTSGSGVAGAQVEVQRGGDLLGTAFTDQDGRFRMAFDVGTSPEAQNVTLLVTHEGFESQSRLVVVTAGQPEPRFTTLELLPRAVSRCPRPGAHGGIVGYFSAPPASLADLSERIAKALTYNLLTRIQRFHVPSDFQPSFVACTEARPRAMGHGRNYARVLEADVFLSGEVRPGATGYDVFAYVSDRFDLFMPPHRAVNERVDLDDPGAAELDPATHVAILTAVARSYEQNGRYAECIDVTVAAEQIHGGLTPAIEERRSRCQAQLANRGLLRGDSP